MSLTLEQLVLGGGALLISGLFTVVLVFLKGVLKKLDHLDSCLSNLQLRIEREFVSFDTFSRARDELRQATIELWKADAEKGRVLAKLEAHIDIANLLRQLLAKGG